jgi:anti-sigma factor RsiW
MLWKYGHLSREELLRFLDGELPAFRTYRARRHLIGCHVCRSRERQIESAIEELLCLYRISAESRIARDRMRANLQAKLRWKHVSTYQSETIIPIRFSH